MKTRLRMGWALGLALSMASNWAQDFNGPIRVSPDGRYFVDPQGHPVFWLGTTQWQLCRDYNLEDVRTIVERSRANGFAFAQVMLLGVGDGTKTNVAGAQPWTSTDPLTPNETYFQHVDAVLSIAREKHFVISLTLYHQRWRKLITQTNARTWATWLARRYRDLPNLVWSMTPEAKPEFAPVLRELAAGLREGDGGAHLITFKPDPAPFSSSFLHQEKWLDFDSMQTWKSVELIYPFVTKDYQLQPVKPVLMAEGAYEHGSEYGFEVTPLWIRRQAYYSYLAGAHHTYGHNDSWRVLPTWKAALDAPGARQLGVLKKVFQARLEWWRLVPDQTIFASGGNTNGQVLNLAARHPEGRWIMAYLGAPASCSIDLNKLAGPGPFAASWLDPRTGESTRLSPVAKAGGGSFTTPDSWEDALLILESEGASAGPPARDASAPIDRRTDELLARMTLAEKVGQINMPCVYEAGLGPSVAAKAKAVQAFAAGNYVPGIGPAGGYFTLPNTILLEGPRQQAEFLNQLQHIAREQTRLGIPLLQTEEGTHGLMCPGGTIFPEGPALGSTWDLDLLSQVYATMAREARAIGVHQNFTLVVEPIRDPRLGRNEEAYSEDPFLCGRIATTIVRAAQGTNVAAPDKVVAGLCHYPGQSQPVSGFERGAMEVSERMLREVFLPPWQAGIKDSGGLGVMATYPAIDGVPTHASKKLLTAILRQEFGFDGLVLSEGGGIGTLVYEGLASTQKEAGALALAAGVDVGISFESGYLQDLIENVREGKVPVELVDRAVRRVLRQKLRLGLFEQPFVDPDRAVATVHQASHQAIALQAAREALVLLKNDQGLLPLKKAIRSIAVIGPNAEEPRNQLGDYIPTTVPQHITTVLEGIKAIVAPEAKVIYVKGCEVVGNDLNQLEQARAAAAAAEVAIVVIGENERRAPGRTATDGEGYDAATLELTGLQEELVKTVHGTGTPTVVVLINGRPLATRWIAQHVPAVIEAWLPGELGGQAVAEVLFGACNPSGRLSVTVPRHAGQLPVYYNAKKSKRYWMRQGWGRAYVDLEPTPLYPFGFGLSYTHFEYSQLELSTRQIPPNGSVTVRLTVKNTGERAGAEVVQLYLEDVVASVATPSKQLRGFTRIALEPGEARTCTFKLTSDDLALYDQGLQHVVEPGEFRVLVGASSEDIRLKGEFWVAPAAGSLGPTQARADLP